ASAPVARGARSSRDREDAWERAGGKDKRPRPGKSREPLEDSGHARHKNLDQRKPERPLQRGCNHPTSVAKSTVSRITPTPANWTGLSSRRSPRHSLRTEKPSAATVLGSGRCSPGWEGRGRRREPSRPIPPPGNLHGGRNTRR